MRNIFPLFEDKNITVEEDEEEVKVTYKKATDRAEVKPLMPDVENLRVSLKCSTNVLLSWTWNWTSARLQRNLSLEEAEDLMTNMELVEVRFDGQEMGEFLCESGFGWGRAGGPQALWLDSTKEGNHSVCLRAFRPPPPGYTKSMRGAWSSAIKFEAIPLYKNASELDYDQPDRHPRHGRKTSNTRKMLVWKATKDAISPADKAEIMRKLINTTCEELSLPLPDVEVDALLTDEEKMLIAGLSNQSEVLRRSLVSRAEALERCRVRTCVFYWLPRG
eukprot:766658-Hanusia_phi.AAC.3